MTTTAPTTTAAEREDLIAMLAHARHFLRFTTRDLTDDQARLRTTPSAFCLGDIIKHVTGVEEGWERFLAEGAAGLSAGGTDPLDWSEEDFEQMRAAERMGPEDSLEHVLAEHERAAARTDATVRSVESLDTVYDLPRTPWPMDARWSVRRAILHIVAETTQHAGHADIIREALDGAKSMG